MVSVANCCLVLDLRPGCIVIGSVSAFFNLMFVIGNFAVNQTGPLFTGIFNIIMLIFSIFLIIGAATKMRGFVIAYIVCQLITIVITFLLLIGVIIMMIIWIVATDDIEEITLDFYPDWITEIIGVAFGVTIFMFILVLMFKFYFAVVAGSYATEMKSSSGWVEGQPGQGDPVITSYPVQPYDPNKVHPAIIYPGQVQ